MDCGSLSPLNYSVSTDSLCIVFLEFSHIKLDLIDYIMQVSLYTHEKVTNICLADILMKIYALNCFFGMNKAQHESLTEM